NVGPSFERLRFCTEQLFVLFVVGFESLHRRGEVVEHQREPRVFQIIAAPHFRNAAFVCQQGKQLSQCGSPSQCDLPDERSGILMQWNDRTSNDHIVRGANLQHRNTTFHSKRLSSMAESAWRAWPSTRERTEVLQSGRIG